MRFFTGARDKSQKKFASSLFKQLQDAKPFQEETADDKYKKTLEKKIEKIQENIMTGAKTHAFKLPGTKSDKDQPKELSNNKKQAIQMIALKKALKSHKVEKKKEVAWNRQQNAIKKAAKSAADMAAEEIIEQAKREAEAAYAAAQTSTASSFFFGSGSDDNNSW